LDVDGVISDMAAVWEVVGDETARLRRFWGERGCMGGEWGHSDGSGSMSRRFRAVASGLERGRAGVSVINDDDVAVSFGGSRCGTGDRGTSWGG
jgi:hypothetical protein